MRRVVLFDLGGTLVEYYGRPETSQVIGEAVRAVETYLEGRGLLRVGAEQVRQRVGEEDYGVHFTFGGKGR